MALIMGYETTWEYLEERTAGTTPTGGSPGHSSYRMPGYLTGDVPISVNVNPHNVRGLKSPNATEHRGLDAIMEGKNEYEWSAEYVPQKANNSPYYIWTHFFCNAMNNMATTCGAGTYTYGTVTDDIKPFTINKVSGSVNEVLKGCMIDSIKVECSVDDVVKVSVSGKGLSLGTAAVTLGSFSHASAILSDPLMWSDCEVVIAGITFTNVTDFNFELKNNLDSHYHIKDTNAEYPDALTVGVRDIEGAVTIDFEGHQEYNKLVSSTAQDVVIKIGTRKFTLSNCKWKEFEFPGATEDLLQVELPFTAEGIAESSA